MYADKDRRDRRGAGEWIFNLNPWRKAIFAELARVVRPGGSVCSAELIGSASAASTKPGSEISWPEPRHNTQAAVTITCTVLRGPS
jgi:hypothetical protein